MGATGETAGLTRGVSCGRAALRCDRGRPALKAGRRIVQTGAKPTRSGLARRPGTVIRRSDAHAARRASHPRVGSGANSTAAARVLLHLSQGGPGKEGPSTQFCLAAVTRSGERCGDPPSESKRQTSDNGHFVTRSMGNNEGLAPFEKHCHEGSLGQSRASADPGCRMVDPRVSWDRGPCTQRRPRSGHQGTESPKVCRRKR